MRRVPLLFVLVAAQVALAQGTPAPEISAQEPSPQEPSPQGPPSQVQVLPASEAAPPLVQAPAEPQPAAPSAGSDSPLSLTRGARIYVRSGSAPAGTGELVGMTPGALSLEIESGRVVDFKLADVEQVDVRKRNVAPTALMGLGAGGVGGVLLFLPLCAAAVSETSGSAVPCAVLGTLLSSAVGAAAGAIIGMAVPGWSTLYKRKQGEAPPPLRLREPEEDVLAHWFSGDLPMGEVGLQLGYARDIGVSLPTDGLGGRLYVLVLIGPYFALGPELAWYGGVGTHDVEFNGQVSRVERDLFQVGGLARFGVTVGPVRVAALGGLGNYSIGSDHLGASMGGEVEVRPPASLPPLALEVRYHRNLNDDKDFADPNQLTIGLGTRLRW